MFLLKMIYNFANKLFFEICNYVKKFNFLTRYIYTIFQFINLSNSLINLN